MSLLTKTKFTMWTVLGLTIVYAIVSAVSVVAMRPSTNGDGPNQDHYLLSVKFKPNVSLAGVSITASVDGIPLINKLDRHLSPWDTTLVAQKGATVVLTVTSTDTTSLDCFMSRNGTPLDLQEAQRGFGTIVCTSLGK